MADESPSPILTISQVCSLHNSLETDLKDFAKAQCGSMEVWLTKLESFLQGHSEERFKELLDEYQISVPVASYQGGLLASQGDARQAAWDQFRQRLELCLRLDISTIVVAADALPPLDQAAIERIRYSAREIAVEAGRRQLRVALEFQARSAFVNNLMTCVALVEEVASPYLGICLDAFHYYIGCSKSQDLSLLSADNLFHVQFCDTADTPREFATDSDRILPGDGDINLSQILDRLKSIGYQQAISLELLNPKIWQIPSRQVAEIGMDALKRVLV